MALAELLVSPTDYKGALLIFLCYGSVTLFLCYMANIFMKWQRKAWIINQIPGPRSLPIIGNAIELNIEATEFFKLYFTQYCQYGSGLFRVWIGLTPICAIYNAAGAEIILRNQKYIDKNPEYGFLHSWLGFGLLTSTGRKWQQRRKQLTPSFHFQILDKFIEVFNQKSIKFVSKLQERKFGEELDIFPLVSLCTLDIIFETAMGISINAQDNAHSEYVEVVQRAGSHIIRRFRTPWLRPDFLFNLSSYGRDFKRCLQVLHKTSTECIQERKMENQRMKSSNENDKEEILGKRKRLAFLDMLLEYSEGENGLSDEEIRDEVDTFMFEGHDTTAAGINWTIYLLGSHPEIQEKVFEELDSIFGDTDRPATTEDLREMKYLECCVKESLRILPPVPFIGRMLQEDVQINGYTIPKGTSINILIYSIHQDPEHFPEPDKFIPERFFTENAAQRHPYAYIPFSAGPRNCIGQKFALMEEKLVLSWLFRKFRFESMQRKEDLKLLPDIIIRPEDGTIVKLFSRK